MYLMPVLSHRSVRSRRVLLAVAGAVLAALLFAAALVLPARDVRHVLGAKGAAAVSGSGPAALPNGLPIVPAALPASPENLDSLKLRAVAADAQALNAADPFATTKPDPARPFHFAGSAEDRARAIQCLALGAMAEAGGGDPGQRAVIQVILNRVRHPAFAKTVCGVIFQGSERGTGCQFTFTCDGAMARQYSAAAWVAARKRAGEALDGKIFAPVGTATHYHTDWVYPVWSPSLEKIARVDTHLFYRWPGYWGSRAASRFDYRGGEPAIAALGVGVTPGTAPVAGAGPTLAGAIAAVNTDVPSGAGSVVVRHPEGGSFLVALPKTPATATTLAFGRRLCGAQGYCQVLGWTDRAAVPKGYPVPPEARARLAFSYVMDASNRETVYYDCQRFKGECSAPSTN